jgi:hypothetical protein
MEKRLGERKHRLPKWARWVLGIVAALAALYLGPDLILRYRIHRELAAIRAEGYPVTAAEFQTWSGLPPGDDYQDLLRKSMGEVLRLAVSLRPALDARLWGGEEIPFWDVPFGTLSLEGGDPRCLIWTYDCEVSTVFLQEILTNRRLSADEIRKISKAFTEAETRDVVVSGIARGRCVDNDRFAGPAENLPTVYASTTGEKLYWHIYSMTYLKRLDHLFTLQTVRRALLTVRLPLRHRAKIVTASKDKVRDAGFWIHPRAYFAEVESGRAIYREVTAIASLHMSRLALAVEQHRLTTGKLPDSIGDMAAEIVESLPPDVMDGSFIRYIKQGDGYEIVCDALPYCRFTTVKPVASANDAPLLEHDSTAPVGTPKVGD